MKIATIKRTKHKSGAYLHDSQIGASLYGIPSSYVPSYHFDAFNMLYRFENALRLFIYVILKSEYGANWANTKIRQDKDLTISNAFKQRKKELENYGHMGKLSNIPMLYLTLDELISIILGESLRRLFKPHFPASLDRVYKTKLWELIILRNNLVHFRRFTEKDFNRLINNMEDLVIPIQSYLDSLINFDHYHKFIPTKRDDWYSGWMPLFLKDKIFSHLHISRSKCKCWIKLNMDIRVLEKKIGEESYYYTIDIKKVIDSLRDILQHVIYFTFGIDFPFPEDDVNYWSSGAYLRFSYGSFKKNYNDILSLLLELIDNIESELQKVSHLDKDTERDESLKYISRCLDSEFPFNMPNFDFAENWNGLTLLEVDHVMVLEMESPWVK